MIEFNATFIVAMVSFIVFMFIMNAIFYKPVLFIINKREKYISSNYDDAKKLSQKAEDCTNEYNQKILEENIKNREIISNAVERANNAVLDKIKTAKENAVNEIQSRKAELNSEREKLLTQVNLAELKNLISAKITGGKV